MFFVTLFNFTRGVFPIRSLYMIRVVHFIFSELDIDNFDILIYGTMIAIGIKTNINKLLRNIL